MPKGKDIGKLLAPIAEKAIQAYFGQGLHSLGLLNWLLLQTGRSEVWVSSYSTSEAFLSGFYLMRQKRLVSQSAILLDQRAARKTVHLERLMDAAFDRVFLGQNHSKLLLLRSEKGVCVSVITSQNQTYGARAESTVVTTDTGVFDVLLKTFSMICDQEAAQIDVRNGKGIITQDRGPVETAADTCPDWRPIGAEW